jgi:hypothetical protein
MGNCPALFFSHRFTLITQIKLGTISFFLRAFVAIRKSQAQ